jgi:hypothetical protein
MEKKLRFAIRMKTYRYVTVLGGNSELVGKSLKVGELPDGEYSVTFKNLSKPCFLSVRTLPGYKTPIRVLSNECGPNIVERYLERWEIERVFKSGKQEFDLERIGTKSKRKVDNLIATVQLCLGICAYTYREIESEVPGTEAFKHSAIRLAKKKATVSAAAFLKEMKVFLKRVSLKFNRNSIIRFIGEYMKKIRKMKWNL